MSSTLMAPTGIYRLTSLGSLLICCWALKYYTHQKVKCKSFRLAPSTGGVSSKHCWLVEGTRQKNYRPLLERPCCESLESRINHFVKRGRLEREEGENGGEMVHRGKRSKHSHHSPSMSTKQRTDQKEDWHFLTRKRTWVYFAVIFVV